MGHPVAENRSYVNEGNDFIKGSDWLYCKHVSYGEEYEILWDAPTPSGGDYSIAYYYDEDGIPCVKSKADFVNKLGIAQKEAYETIYWLKVLYGSELIGKEQYDDLITDVEELHKILSSSIKTIKDSGEIKS